MFVSFVSCHKGAMNFLTIANFLFSGKMYLKFNITFCYKNKLKGMNVLEMLTVAIGTPAAISETSL